MRTIAQLSLAAIARRLPIASIAVLVGISGGAQAAPSVPYMPTWQVRHHLERLADEANLQLITTHWPLPSAAVINALEELPNDISPSLIESREYVRDDIRKNQRANRITAQFRNRAEAPVGFGENYTPGSSAKFGSKVFETTLGALPISACIGARLEDNANSLQTSYSGGLGKNGRYQLKLDDAAVVAETHGINIQAFAHQNWWGPGWQSSLINSNNIPAWTGIGVQRSEVRPSHSRWLSWMGPWTAEMFFAQAQDPVMAANQPDGYYFIGTRLTMKPWPAIEIGLTRGMQAMGHGRPSGVNDLLKAMFSGGSTHTESGQLNEDLSNSVAGYDVKIGCATSWRCAAYLQWMGEDASGQSHLPNQFMTLAGVEWWSAAGRHRVFYEFVQTYAHSLPWNEFRYIGTGYRNWAYPQGFTNGGRWIGSSFGGDARVLTLGWMDMESSTLLKVYAGETSTALGSYNPNTNATGNLIGPHGKFSGLSVQRTFNLNEWSIIPEFAYTHLSDGLDVGMNRTTNMRAGITFSKTWGDD